MFFDIHFCFETFVTIAGKLSDNPRKDVKQWKFLNSATNVVNQKELQALVDIVEDGGLKPVIQQVISCSNCHFVSVNLTCGQRSRVSKILTSVKFFFDSLFENYYFQNIIDAVKLSNAGHVVGKLAIQLYDWTKN